MMNEATLATAVDSFVARLALLRARRDLTPLNLGMRARIDPKRLRRLEFGFYKCGPRLDEVERLARVLRCTPEWLAWGRGESP